MRSEPNSARTYLDELAETEFAAPGEADPTFRTLGYQPALEGLRAILLLLVVFGHSEQYLTGRVIGVPIRGLGIMSLFFILSGFLITAIVMKSLQTTGSIHYKSFLKRRVQRLYPPVLLFLLVYIILNLWIGEPLVTPPGSKIIGVLESFLLMLFSLINFTPTFGYAERFDSVNMWSLGVDMQLYLLLPLLIWVLLRWSRNLKQILMVLLTMFVGFQILRLVEYYFLFYRREDHKSVEALIAQSGVYERPENSAGAFLVGVALYLIWSKGLMPVALFKKIWIPTLAVLVYLMITVTPSLSNFAFFIGFTIVSILGAVIIGEALREGSAIGRVCSSNPVRIVGRVSYTVYVWHMFVFMMFSAFGGKHLNWVVKSLGAWTILGVVSTAAWWIAERPLVRLPPVRSAKPSAEPPPTGSPS